MLKNYLTLAWRNLTRSKTYGFINIFGLAAGTLCCLYILLYVQDQYSYDKHFADAKDLYRLTTIWTVQEDKGNWATVTAPVAPAMKKDFGEVVDYARIVPAIGVDHHLLRYKDRSFYEKAGVYADSSLFSMFNFHFDQGDARTALAAPYSVVLMKEVADKLFGSADPIGKVIQMDNTFGKHDFTVSGVIDESLGKSHIHADFFMSMNSGGFGEFAARNNSWAGNNFIISYVKLRPNADVAAMERKLPAFLDKYGQKQLKELGMKKELHLQPISQIHTTPGFRGLDLSTPVSPKFLSILLLIAAMIQIIACINFMNLSTARATKRAKEVGVRKVIGAGRPDLIRQFLGESFLLSLLAVVIALPLLILLLPALNSITQADVRLQLLHSGILWGMLGLLVVVNGLVAGSYPAFYLSAFEAIKVIKGNFTNHISGAGIRKSLVVFQFVLSIVLIAGIIVIYSQLQFMKNKDLGYDKEQKIGFSFYTDDATAKIPAFINHLRGLAEVTSVSRANNYPGQPVLYDMHLFLAGGNIAAAPDASLIYADEHFIRTAGIRMAGGRDFRANDSGRVIINESMARKLGIRPDHAEGVILHSQNWKGEPIQFELAGVIKDYNFSSLHESVKPLAIQYALQPGSEVFISIRSANYPALMAKIGAFWQRELTGTPFEFSFLDEEAQKQYATEVTLSKIINSFTMMALFISALGLFGLAAFSAEQRIKEIGVRKVLGASVLDLTVLLSKDFFMLVGIAVLIATPIGWWAMSSWLEEFAYRTPLSWWMFAAAGVAALLVTLVTVSSQAVRAALGNPVRALRSE
jgi:putative ABC transport system permease protein